jgi:hypothetical protein
MRRAFATARKLQTLHQKDPVAYAYGSELNSESHFVSSRELLVSRISVFLSIVVACSFMVV